MNKDFGSHGVDDGDEVRFITVSDYLPTTPSTAAERSGATTINQSNNKMEDTAMSIENLSLDALINGDNYNHKANDIGNGNGTTSDKTVPHSVEDAVLNELTIESEKKSKEKSKKKSKGKKNGNSSTQNEETSTFPIPPGTYNARISDVKVKNGIAGRIPDYDVVSFAFELLDGSYTEIPLNKYSNLRTSDAAELLRVELKKIDVEIHCREDLATLPKSLKGKRVSISIGASHNQYPPSIYIVGPYRTPTQIDPVGIWKKVK